MDVSWKWNGDKEITLASVMGVLILIVTCLAIWNYVTLKRRREAAAVRREVLRIARNAQAKEERAKRRKEIQDALISCTANDCECIAHSKSFVRRTFSTITLVTENESVLSDDIENQDNLENQETHDNLHQEGGFQMCPICLEEYVAGENVSWSRHQNCHHAFHKSCIEGWLKQLDRDGCCPFCRGPYLNKNEAGTCGKENADPDSQVDIENQNNSESQLVQLENGNTANKLDSFKDTSQLEVIGESNESTVKSPVGYSSFCIVHGLMR